jgi:hypothetical protein
MHQQQKTEGFLQVQIYWRQEELRVYGVAAAFGIVMIRHADGLQFFQVPKDRPSARAE